MPPSTPTRRAAGKAPMKQQTLAASMGAAPAVTTTSVTTTTAPTHGVASVPLTAAVGLPTTTPSTASALTIPATLASRSSRSQTRILPGHSLKPSFAAERPRRSPTPVVIQEPYEKFTFNQLRGECSRRAVDCHHGGGRDQGKLSKAVVIDILRQADALAAFSRKPPSSGKDAPKDPAPGREKGKPRSPARKSPAPRRRGRKPKHAEALRVKKPIVSVRSPRPSADALPALTATTALPTQIAVVGSPTPSNAPTENPSSAHPSTSLVFDLTSGSTSPADVEMSQSSILTQVADNQAPDRAPCLVPTVDSENIQTPVPTTKNKPLGGKKAKAVKKMAAVNPSTGGEATAKASTVRARRGCRFRLINVLTSPDFKSRWSEINDPPVPPADVNPFWSDLHCAFLCENSVYDTLHYQDALFYNVMPEVIRNHTALKLQQMWNDIHSFYKRAVSNMKQEPGKPFFDFCGGRADILYLHMAAMVDHELAALVSSPTGSFKKFTVNGSKPTGVASQAKGSVHVASKRNGKPQTAEVICDELEANTRSNEANLTDQSKNSNARMASPKRNLDVNSSRAHSGPPSPTPKFVELENPDMLPDWLLEDQAKTARARGISIPDEDEQSTEESPVRVDPVSSPRPASNSTPILTSSTPPNNPVQTTDLVLHSSAINSIDDEYASSDYEASDSQHHRQHSRRVGRGKRQREAPTTDLVEVPVSHELVSHPRKRMAVTTTMTRSQELMLPPDEFDVLHNRLRKMNECIDQCYRTLSNSDGILNDMHREDVENDLRFYLGIKKRLQEQILMCMHNF